MFFCGLGFNAVFVILESRTNPKLLAVSYELNLCVASGSTMIIPVLAKMPDPIPTIWFIVCGSVIIFIVIKIGSDKSASTKKKLIDNMELTFLSMI